MQNLSSNFQKIQKKDVKKNPLDFGGNLNHVTLELG